MAIDTRDREQLQQALALAEQAIGVSDPNPRVGCVIGSADGSVIAQGFTQTAGSHHAEAEAIASAKHAGRSMRGGTAWVTLEPCAHHGRTPPCCDALIDAGIARAVIARVDPFPQVAGQGIARMRAAGIDVQVLDPGDELALQAQDLNVGFFARVTRGRPWVRLKVATSLDGRTALANGASQWLTGPAARVDVHHWRRRASAVVTGIGTVLHDSPRMDVRMVQTRLQPLRIVLDSSLRTPIDAPILRPPGRCLIATLDRTRRSQATKAESLEAAGAEIVTLPAAPSGLDVSALLQLLSDRQVNEVHVEGGARINGSFIASGMVDELLLYQAPLVLGSGPSMADFSGLQHLAQARRFVLSSTTLIDGDLRHRFCAAESTDEICRNS